MVTLALAGLAFALPSIDDPLKTGSKSPDDAALIIGIEDYTKLPDVPFARRDAEAFKDWAVYTKGILPSRIRMLNQDAVRELILGAAEDLGSSVRQGGTLWIYYAGHGAADPKTGERMLVGADAQSDERVFQARGVRLQELERLGSAGGGDIAMVIDACYSGVGRGGEDLVAGKRFVVPAYSRVVENNIMEWNAAGPDELSGPLQAAQHGAFTYFAVGALRGWADGELDGTRDGKVSTEEAHQYVQGMLAAAQLTSQHPHLQAPSQGLTLIESVGLETGPTADLLLTRAPEPAPAVTSAIASVTKAKKQGSRWVLVGPGIAGLAGGATLLTIGQFVLRPNLERDTINHDATPDAKSASAVNIAIGAGWGLAALGLGLTTAGVLIRVQPQSTGGNLSFEGSF